MKIKLLTLLMILNISLNAQTNSEKRFYYGFDEKIEINPLTNKMLVKTKPVVSKLQYEQLAKKRLGKIKTEWKSENLCKIELVNSGEWDKKIKELLADDEVVSIKPYYKTNCGLELGLSDEVILKFKQNIKDSEKEKILKRFGLQHVKSTKIYECYHLAKDKDIIFVANELYESGLFEFAYPNLFCKAELFEIPNDPYFQYQVALHNTGQTFNGHTGTADADIDAPEAWNITHGSSNIVIAVLDQGVTSNHPDLPNTRQVRLSGSNFGSGNSNDPSPTGNDNHGNACAGIIGATMNNNQGIAGIAPNCKIMPLRFDKNTPVYMMADAIEFAVDNGANIISNSWGYGTINTNFHLIIKH
jgi:subtilisin family serine protease